MTDDTSHSSGSVLASSTYMETGMLTESVKQAAIDAMVAGRSNAAPIFRPERTPDATITATSDDVGSLSSEELYAYAVQMAQSDDGAYDYDAAHTAAMARAHDLQVKVNAHYFDRETGEKKFNITGDQRRGLETALRAAVQEAELSYYAAREVAKARAAHRAQIEANQNEKALRLAWTGSDPTREKALNDALLRVEADELAGRIHELRRR